MCPCYAVHDHLRESSKLSSNFSTGRYDVAIIGAGVLGVSLYYWLTTHYGLNVVILEKEGSISMHTSSRNTGVIHRPFYLDPVKKKTQARSAGISYSLWGSLARLTGSPWLQCGTVEIARTEHDLKMLEKYGKWSLDNGLEESDFEVIDGKQVSELEPEVECEGAIHSVTDVSTDFGILTNELFRRSGNDGSKILTGWKVTAVEENGEECRISVEGEGRATSILSDLVINASGGSSLSIAHAMGYGKEYSVLFFRGEYWKVMETFGQRIRRNIYSVPRHTKYPFLDPHFINRAEGLREIGPNAVLVGGPEVYSGISSPGNGILSMLLRNPASPKLRLLFNREFISLLSSEWRSSLYKNEMAERVRSFIPALDNLYLKEKGIAGVRGSLIDKTGFVPEAVQIYGDSSIHILNYNSPGATGAPAYAVKVIRDLEEKGYIRNRDRTNKMFSEEWNFDRISETMLSMN